MIGSASALDNFPAPAFGCRTLDQSAAVESAWTAHPPPEGGIPRRLQDDLVVGRWRRRRRLRPAAIRFRKSSGCNSGYLVSLSLVPTRSEGGSRGTQEADQRNGAWIGNEVGIRRCRRRTLDHRAIEGNILFGREGPSMC